MNTELGPAHRDSERLSSGAEKVHVAKCFVVGEGGVERQKVGPRTNVRHIISIGSSNDHESNKWERAHGERREGRQWRRMRRSEN